jgi:hypothetical protein
MKRWFIIIFVLLCGMMAFSTFSAALDADFVLENLPGEWEGTFTWNDISRPVQPVRLTVTDISIDPDGNIFALGDGEYDKDVLVEFSFKWSINPETLDFEMWEGEPKPSDKIVTDGSHVGEISEDLDEIEAVWTTTSTGEQGILYLEPKR